MHNHMLADLRKEYDMMITFTLFIRGEWRKRRKNRLDKSYNVVMSNFEILNSISLKNEKYWVWIKQTCHRTPQQVQRQMTAEKYLLHVPTQKCHISQKTQKNS